MQLLFIEGHTRHKEMRRAVSWWGRAAWGRVQLPCDFWQVTEIFLTLPSSARANNHHDDGGGGGEDVGTCLLRLCEELRDWTYQKHHPPGTEQRTNKWLLVLMLAPSFLAEVWLRRKYRHRVWKSSPQYDAAEIERAKIQNRWLSPHWQLCLKQTAVCSSVAC